VVVVVGIVLEEMRVDLVVAQEPFKLVEQEILLPHLVLKEQQEELQHILMELVVVVVKVQLVELLLVIQQVMEE
tara:strand:+ start:50 stop:271 length:222 start_codon:yes stop_codon:yes gene_type:complete